MKYLGGKWRQGPAIAETVLPHLLSGKAYIEPFCGAMGSAWRVAEAMHRKGLAAHMLLSDIQEPLMTMWRAVIQKGWIPPGAVSEAEYGELKKRRDPKNPATAFAGYACAFAGKYFGTYARSNRDHTQPQHNYAADSGRATLAKAAMLRTATASPGSLILPCRDYRLFAGARNSVFYLDPPYAGRTPSGAEKRSIFNHAEFWQFARTLSQHNSVFVTEFRAPIDFVSVHSWGNTVTSLHAGEEMASTDERIFVHESFKEALSPRREP